MVVVVEARTSRFTETEKTNHAWDCDCKETKYLLEGCETEYQREEKKEFQFEYLENQQKGNEKFLQLFTF